MGNRSDNFDRANSATSLGSPSDGGSAWSALTGTWGINSNQGYCLSVTQRTAVLESSLSSVSVQVTLSVTSDAVDVGLVVRASDANNYILGTIDDTTNQMKLFKRVSGSFTQLGSTYTGATFANGDVFLLDVDASNNITWKQNGVTRVTANDSHNSTQTKHGLRLHAGTNARFDDFSITDNTSSLTANAWYYRFQQEAAA